ncbi:MAG: hypothetical protein WC045_04185 [Patescibacteria group bacterium]
MTVIKTQIQKFLILSLTILVTSFVFGRVDLALAAVPAIVECHKIQCTVDTGQSAYLVVQPLDDNLTPISNTPVTYTWTTEIGVFATPPTISPIVTGSVSSAGKVWTDINQRAESRVFLSIPAGSLTQETNKKVTVLATYAGGSQTVTYSLSSTCITDPKLYYGIASVEVGAYKHSSVAEVLETCRPEYKLKAITGERY